MFLQQGQTLYLAFSFLAVSVDHPISKLYDGNKEFIKFKKQMFKKWNYRRNP